MISMRCTDLQSYSTKRKMTIVKKSSPKVGVVKNCMCFGWQPRVFHWVR